MFDLIGIDWGSKRFGIAFGSSNTGLVINCTYKCPTTKILEIIQKEAQERKAKTIIVGLPLTWKLQHTEVTKNVLAFVDELKNELWIKESKLKIEIINERNTTKRATDKIGNSDKDMINHQSASEILKHYLGSV